MPDPEVIVSMQRFKADLLRREQFQMQEMARRWLEVERALDAQIAALAEEFARRRSNGETLTRGALFRLERYQALLAQLQTELRGYTDFVAPLIEEQQRQYAQLAIQHAATAIDASVTTSIGAQFDRLPIEAVEHMVGLAGDGSPLRRLLVDAWPDAAQGLTQELIRSTALGVNPRETARRMADGTTRTLTRMLTISRTEQLRVYRETARAAYIHSGVVRGYRRLATRDSRTCIGCLSSDGQEFPLDVPFQEHPQGRCTAIPVVIGMPTPKPQESTEQWFSRQTPDVQRSILGKGRFELWQRGDVGWGDFAAVRHSDTWGDAIVPATLGELTTQKPPSVVRRQVPSIPVFANRRDAETWLVNNRYAKTADFGKLDIDSVNALAKSVVDHSVQFDKMKDGIDFIGSAQAGSATLLRTVKETAQREAVEQGLTGAQIDRYVDIITKKYKPFLGKVPDGIYAYVEQRALPGSGRLERNMVFNEKWGRKSSTLVESLKEGEASGMHPVGVNSIKSVIDHELGHVVDELYKVTQSDEMRAILRKAEKMPGGIAANVSIYATTNPGEFLAEAWSEYLNNPNPRQIAREVGELIRSLA